MEDLFADIADLLDSGEKIYLHKVTQEILSHPDPQRWDDAETDFLMDQVLEKVVLDPHNYITLDPPDARESFRLMEEFAFTVPDQRQQMRLIDALKGKKPFRLFRQVVEDCELEDAWYDYKIAQLKEWVKEQLALKWDE
jgi:hypothetical protein